VKKKLIEVALPLEAINKASAREKSIRHGHPSTLHLWWARRPLAAARAVIFAQMVDDPSAHPDLFPTEKAQEQERQRLFGIIEDLVLWENTTNETVLQAARDEIWASWRRACGARSEYRGVRSESWTAPEIKADEALFNPDKLPAFHDPFAGGGALPLEAQRLGLEAFASDLNPVAVLINKAMIEIPPKFAGRPPVNPNTRSEWRGERRERNALSRDDSVAEGHVGGAGALSSGSSFASGGDLRNALSDYSGSGVRSGEHRGGMDARIGQGQGPFSGDCARIACGNGNAIDTLRGPAMVSAEGNGDLARAAGRSEPNADNHASEALQRLTSHSSLLFPRSYRGAQGLAEDVRYYGKWMRDEAEKRIGHLYPKVEVSAEMAKDRPDLKQYVGQKLTVIAWLWARTVKSPNPAFAQVDVPLASTFMLSTKAGKEAYVEVVREEEREVRGSAADSHSSLLSPRSSPYRFTVRTGKPKDAEGAKRGTKLARGANFQCVMSATPIAGDYIKAEGKAGRMGARLMAIVAEGDRGRVYLAPTPEHEAAALKAKPEWKPETPLPADMRSHWTPPYGLTTYGDLFTSRQLVALTTFSDLVQEARERVQRDGIKAGLPADPKPLRDGGTGAMAYAEAVGVYLAFAIDKCTDYWNSIATWMPRGTVGHLFARHAVPMTWDFPEANPLSEFHCAWHEAFEWVAKSMETLPSRVQGAGQQDDAAVQSMSSGKVVSTDPPYYDNIGYADLSDFFYVWLRRSLRPVFPDLFATLAVPKAEELVATPYRHGSKDKAESFFLDGMTQAMHRLAEQAHPAFPVSIYYAFKQAESDDEKGTASTGWDTFLAAVIEAGFAISGTWPMRTERGARSIGIGTNALASSIILVCRQRSPEAPTATRREFIAALKAELPAALAHLQRGNIAPVDLAQAAIGPGMAVYTRFRQVLDAEGRPVTVREALALINQTLDEALAGQGGDLDPDSRWALTWFEQQGFAEGEYDVAEQLSKSKNTSVAGMVKAGILESKRGKVRLLRPQDLPADWDPEEEKRGKRSEKREGAALTPLYSFLTGRSSTT